MLDYRRSHTCGELRGSDEGKTVSLSGWVHRRRDLGPLIFIDLRDRYGLTQVVFDTQKNPSLHAQAEKLRLEWVISVRGKVQRRGEKALNLKLPTGEIEIAASEVTILSEANTTPFQIGPESDAVHDEIRLKYRYLDIRRGEITRNLLLRHQAMAITRDCLTKSGFLEVTTPILSKSTPEGARDYLVPSRIYPGEFYALPQSPQIYKQLLMISGIDRYFQIATCFRDEDLRADRQPEFTQIDLEASFLTPPDLMKIIEELIRRLFQEIKGVSIPDTIPRLSYAEAMERYGSDKPDLRFGMPLVRIDEEVAASQFSAGKEALAKGGCAKALVVSKGASFSRKQLDECTELVKRLGLSGLASVKRTKEGISSSMAKFFSEEQLKQLLKRAGAEEEDLLLFAVGTDERVNQALDHLRRHLSKQLELIDPNQLAFAWITEFPLFAWDPEQERWDSVHNPFTSPHPDDLPLMDQEAGRVRALAYDLVLNGYEIGGGAQRIHDPKVQKKVFELLRLSHEEIHDKFGFFVEALGYGTPPSLGIALGLDRIVMLLAGTDNIRDVIAFPKTQKASDLMMACPSPVAPMQLKELGLSVTESV